MNHSIRNLCAALISVSAIAAVPASAATIYDNQKITQIAAGGAYNGDVVLRLSGHGDMTRPGCATDGTWSLTFDGTTDAGKQAYSMALLAQSSGANIAVSAEAFCIGNIQQLRWIRLK